MAIALSDEAPPPGAPAAGQDTSERAAAATPSRGTPPATERNDSFGPLIASGGTLRLAAAELPTGETMIVDLDLEVAPRSFEPHSTRIVGQGREPLELQAVIDPADPTRARIEVPPAWLIPGVYLVEVKTTEKSHFPLRRYKIVIE